MGIVKGYCMKCKKQMIMLNTVQTVTSKGTTMIKGTCEKCGTKMCRMGSKK
jgi:RNase P subunit RPR2